MSKAKDLCILSRNILIDKGENGSFADDYIKELERELRRKDNKIKFVDGCLKTTLNQINELEEQNKEMLKVLIETVKDYKKLGWGCDEKRMDGWIKVIEKNTCKPIEEIIKNENKSNN